MLYSLCSLCSAGFVVGASEQGRVVMPLNKEEKHRTTCSFSNSAGNLKPKKHLYTDFPQHQDFVWYGSSAQIFCDEIRCSFELPEQKLGQVPEGSGADFGIGSGRFWCRVQISDIGSGSGRFLSSCCLDCARFRKVPVQTAVGR